VTPVRFAVDPSHSRTLALLPLPETAEIGTVTTSFTVAVTIDTDARDATGARRFPDGAQSLEAALVVPDQPGLPGCPVINLGDVDAQQVTLANG
jgi:hypothetical protein